MHLVILLLPDLEEELKVLLYETVGEMLRQILLLLASLLVIVVIPCGDILVCTCLILQLPSWRNLLLHLAASVAIVGVTGLDDGGGGGEEVGIQSETLAQGWHLLFYFARAVKQRWRWRRGIMSSGGGRLQFDPAGSMKLEGSRLSALGGVTRTGEVGDERSLRGGEPVSPREGVVFTSTPLGLSALPGHGGGDREVEEGVSEGWGKMQGAMEGDRGAKWRVEWREAERMPLVRGERSQRTMMRKIS
jgi:hypothetical protein